MIQLAAKAAFVERYCNPADGWRVFVDVDPSEEGRTGSERKSAESRARHVRTLAEAPAAVERLKQLGAFVGKRQSGWKSCFGLALTLPPGDRDIIAVQLDRRQLWVVEVEGDSGGQPEGKIYKALGQLVCAATDCVMAEYRQFLTAVVWGERAAAHLARSRAAERIGIGGLVLGAHPSDDRWLFGVPPPPP